VLRPPAVSTFLATALDARRPLPLARQLYDELRAAVRDGRVAAGARLPSTRDLAAALGLSRNTVLAAYEQLAAEGYVVGRVGAGTHVAPPAPETVLAGGSRDPGARRSAPRARPARPARLSARGRMLAATPVSVTPPAGPARAFRPGVPAYDAFPFDDWRRRVAAFWARPREALLGYAEPAGWRPLREAIAAHARAARAVRCDAEQVLVVSGSQQGLDLAARLLLDDGDPAWIEDPGYVGARAALQAAGACPVPVPVDAEGLDVAGGIRRAPRARLAYVTPSHQYPAGVVLSRERRIALLAWARRAGAWVLEDDYDSEYRHVGWPLESLQGMDGGERVLYVGTFSKTLFPGLRLGYLIVPRRLAPAFGNARALVDRQPPAADQAALASLLEDGAYARHLRRMRTLYAARRAVLLEAAARELAGRLELRPAETGMHLLGLLPPGVDDRAVSARALELGVEAPALSRYALRRPRRGGLVLGYAGYDERTLRRGVAGLARALAPGGRPGSGEDA
jgi:GntR family transcriptional regulator/MocR family aminotransferase